MYQVLWLPQASQKLKIRSCPQWVYSLLGCKYRHLHYSVIVAVSAVCSSVNGNPRVPSGTAGLHSYLVSLLTSQAQVPWGFMSCRCRCSQGRVPMLYNPAKCRTQSKGSYAVTKSSMGIYFDQRNTGHGRQSLRTSFPWKNSSETHNSYSLWNPWG